MRKIKLIWKIDGCLTWSFVCTLTCRNFKQKSNLAIVSTYTWKTWTKWTIILSKRKNKINRQDATQTQYNESYVKILFNQTTCVWKKIVTMANQHKYWPNSIPLPLIQFACWTERDIKIIVAIQFHLCLCWWFEMRERFNQTKNEWTVKAKYDCHPHWYELNWFDFKRRNYIILYFAFQMISNDSRCFRCIMYSLVFELRERKNDFLFL